MESSSGPLGAARRIVIFRLGSLGDTVVSLPCFHAIARAAPAAERIVLTNFPVSGKAAPLESILAGSGLVDRVIEYPGGTRAPGDLWALARRLRALDADALVYLTESRGLPSAWRDAAFFGLCGLPVFGAPLTRERQRNRVLNAAGEIEHECQRLARCLERIAPVDLDDRSAWDLRLTEAERAGVRALKAPLAATPYIAINMGGKVAQKDWGHDNWRALLDCLTEERPGFGLLVVGVGEDRARAEQVTSGWRGPVVDACGLLSPRESAAILDGAALFIGHDSGPLHLAAARGITAIGLFGDYNLPRRWHPWGSRHRVIHRREGVREIGVREVVALVQDRLDAGAA